MRNSSLLICILFFTLVSSVKGQEAEKETKQKLRLHAVALNVNVMPIFPKGYERRSIPYELPIGRFQPSVRFCRSTPHQWIEFSLLALQPGVTRSVVDTVTITNFVNLGPFLIGQAGTYRRTHVAVGATRGKIGKRRILRSQIINELGVLASYRKVEFTNRADIFPAGQDSYTETYSVALSYAFTLRVINKPRYLLDVKLYNYLSYGTQVRTTLAGPPSSNVFDLELALLTPQVQLVVPFGEK